MPFFFAVFPSSLKSKIETLFTLASPHASLSSMLACDCVHILNVLTQSMSMHFFFQILTNVVCIWTMLCKIRKWKFACTLIQCDQYAEKQSWYSKQRHMYACVNRPQDLRMLYYGIQLNSAASNPYSDIQWLKYSSLRIHRRIYRRDNLDTLVWDQVHTAINIVKCKVAK